MGMAFSVVVGYFTFVFIFFWCFLERECLCIYLFISLSCLFFKYILLCPGLHSVFIAVSFNVYFWLEVYL